MSTSCDLVWNEGDNTTEPGPPFNRGRYLNESTHAEYVD